VPTVATPEAQWVWAETAIAMEPRATAALLLMADQPDHLTITPALTTDLAHRIITAMVLPIPATTIMIVTATEAATIAGTGLTTTMTVCGTAPRTKYLMHGIT